MSKVFINFPFDEFYEERFYAVIFTIVSFGYSWKCGLDELNSGQSRLEKITEQISECDLSIHDLSCIETTKVKRREFPRFNMSFEAGVYHGGNSFAEDGSFLNKKALFLCRDIEQYDYCISDLKGNDPRPYGIKVGKLISEVREFLDRYGNASIQNLPDAVEIQKEYKKFVSTLNKSNDFYFLIKNKSRTKKNYDHITVCHAIKNFLSTP